MSANPEEPKGSITITHTHEDGTILTGSRKGDGVFDIVRRHGFRAGKQVAGLYINGSRDRMSRRHSINGAAEALRANGWEVTVEIDDTSRPTAVRLEAAEERADDRRDSLEERADRAFSAAEAAQNEARRISQVASQPVQPVGHHSRPGHLRDLSRWDAKAGQAVAGYREGARLSERAASTGVRTEAARQPRAMMRRIDTLEAESRALRRDREGICEAEWSERARLMLERNNEEVAYLRGELARHAEAGTFVAWDAGDFVTGDLALYWGGWGLVTRVNAKSLSMDKRTIPWDKIQGRRRDGMQLATPNGTPYPVELAVKLARWGKLTRWYKGQRYNNNAEDRSYRWASRIACGLDVDISDKELGAYWAGFDTVAGRRRLALACVDVYDRIEAGESIPDLIASVVPLECAPAWVMPEGEPQRVRIDRLKAGDITAGEYDPDTGKPARTDLSGPVATVEPSKTDRHDYRDWWRVVWVDGTEVEWPSHVWFLAHVAPEPAEAVEESAVAPEPAPEPLAVAVAQDAAAVVEVAPRAWTRADFKRGDHVHGPNGWKLVARSNPRSVSCGDGNLIQWANITGRRRGDEQIDTPDGTPWLVADAEKVYRWGILCFKHARRQTTDALRGPGALAERQHVCHALRIPLGLALTATAGDVDELLPDGTAARRALSLAQVDVFDRLEAGESAADIIASMTRGTGTAGAEEPDLWAGVTLANLGETFPVLA